MKERNNGALDGPRLLAGLVILLLILAFATYFVFITNGESDPSKLAVITYILAIGSLLAGALIGASIKLKTESLLPGVAITATGGAALFLIVLFGFPKTYKAFIPAAPVTDYEILSMTDSINFTDWKPPLPIASTSAAEMQTSPVTRRFKLIVVKRTAEARDYIDRVTTTGTAIDCKILVGPVKCRAADLLDPRAKHEQRVIISADSFQQHKQITVQYQVTYWDAWRSQNDAWFRKMIPYPIKSYDVTATFPANDPWQHMKVSVQPATAPEQEAVLDSSPNSSHTSAFHWHHTNLKSGDIYYFRFEWPPLSRL